MTRTPSWPDLPIDNEELSYILANYDPVTLPSPSALASLEAKILCKIDAIEPGSTPRGNHFPIWMFNRDWSLGAATVFVLLILVAGILIDITPYNGADEASYASSTTTPTLFTLADDTTTAQLSETLWGDDDDNEQ